MTATDPLGLHPLGIHGTHDNVVLPSPDHTEYFAAGVLSIAVEYRVLEKAAMLEFFKGNDYVTGLYEKTPDGMSFGGLSIHVLEADSGIERLRFDCFPEDPHYHYLVPEEGYELTVVFDPNSNGDMFVWCLERLTSATHLRAMLERAGAPEPAAQVDMAEVRAALVKVTAAAMSATRPESVDMSRVSVAGSVKHGQ